MICNSPKFPLPEFCTIWYIHSEIHTTYINTFHTSSLWAQTMVDPIPQITYSILHEDPPALRGIHGIKASLVTSELSANPTVVKVPSS